MPYKVVHVADSGEFGIISYDDLNDLFEDGWEIEDTQTVTYRGAEGVERYRLRKGAAETAVATRPSGGGRQLSDPTALSPGVLSSDAAARALAQVLAGNASHLGASVGAMIPGASVTSGNSHMLIAGHGADAAAGGSDPMIACPFTPDDAGYDIWMDGYEKQRKAMGTRR